MTALLRLPILERMRSVDGWLAAEEADLLIAGLSRALAGCADDDAVVELGCYQGRATVVLGSVVRGLRPGMRVFAIDPHDGLVGARERALRRMPPTLTGFRRTIGAARLDDIVVTIQRPPHEVGWSDPIAFLLVDGLHDYASVSRDFYTFEAHLTDMALVAFHDYADYFPGVVAFVDELLASGRYRLVARAGSMLLAARGAAR